MTDVLCSPRAGWDGTCIVVTTRACQEALMSARECHSTRTQPRTDTRTAASRPLRSWWEMLETVLPSSAALFSATTTRANMLKLNNWYFTISTTEFVRLWRLLTFPRLFLANESDKTVWEGVTATKMDSCPSTSNRCMPTTKKGQRFFAASFVADSCLRSAELGVRLNSHETSADNVADIPNSAQQQRWEQHNK